MQVQKGSSFDLSYKGDSFNSRMKIIALEKAFHLAPLDKKIRTAYGNILIKTAGPNVGTLIHDTVISADVEKLQVLKEVMEGGEFSRLCTAQLGGEDGYTGLHLAAKEDEIGLSKFFIEDMKLDPEVKAQWGDTPLMIAAHYGQHITADYLLEHGAVVNSSDFSGYTPLHHAVFSGKKEVVKLLLLKGANTRFDSVDGTPLSLAAKHGKVEIVKLLLQNGDEANVVSMRNGCSPLVNSFFSGNAECVEVLLKAGADPNLKYVGKSPLIHAVITKNEDCVKHLLDYDADPNSHDALGLTALEYAAWLSEKKVIQMLFSKTDSIESYSKWTPENLIEEIHSEKFEQKIQRKREMMANLSLKLCKKAFLDKDYQGLVKLYNQSAKHGDEAVLLENRSLCWEKLGYGEFALADAEDCLKLGKDRPLAHFRVGRAWYILKEHSRARDAFKKAVELDPDNKTFQKFFRLFRNI